MPELPEVQTIVNDLNKKIVGRRITDVWSDWQKTVKKPPFKDFQKLIKNKIIVKVGRRAKNILVYLTENYLLLIHLKMTGHLLVGKWKVKKLKGKEIVIPLEPKEAVVDPYNKYIHLIFYLDPVRSRSPRGGRSHSLKARAASNGVDNGQMLGFSDARKFGKIILGKKEQIENLPEFRNLGPEPLDKNLKFITFLKLIKSERRKIKQVLMDPEVIAGIGNIYSDEILWEAKISPLKPANKLSEKELRELWKAMHKILFKALKLRGTSVSDYRDTAGKKGKYAEELLVYRREGEKCLRCGSLIKRIKIGGRSAHYCPHCQKS